jgi:hypothetical protein
MSRRRGPGTASPPPDGFDVGYPLAGRLLPRTERLLIHFQKLVAGDARVVRGYFRLPAVRPPTRWRSMRAKSTTTGTMAMMEAANSAFQCWT